MIILIAIILFIFGCDKFRDENPLNKYGIQPPINNLYWGMTIAEIEKEISIKDGVDNVSYRKDDGETFIEIPDKFNKFGYKVTVILVIDPSYDSDWFPYKTEALSAIELICTDVDSKKLKKKLNKVFGSKGQNSISFSKNECITWKSQDKIEDLQVDERNKLKEFWNVLKEHSGEYAPSKNKSEAESINSVTLSINPAGTDCSITYYGDTAIVINKLCMSNAHLN
jgi:hypothetical protein